MFRVHSLSSGLRDLEYDRLGSKQLQLCSANPTNSGRGGGCSRRSGGKVAWHSKKSHVVVVVHDMGVHVEAGRVVVLAQVEQAGRLVAVVAAVDSG